MGRELSAEDILKMAQGFMECKILHTAAELNLFTILTMAPMPVEEIADKISCDLRALAMLLDALVAMGLLSKSGNKYRCESTMTAWLSAKSAATILPMILHMASLWRRWSRLTDIVRNVPDAREEFEFSRNEEELRAFIGAMHSIGAPMARMIAAAVDPSGSRALLDIGGGSGTYTVAFLRAVPEMRATLFDLPEVIEMARERLQAEGMLDRVTLVCGSFYHDEFPYGFDLALLSAIIHSNSLIENLELYRKVFRALKPGGRILIRDHVMSSDRTFPRDGSVFAINMLVGTSGGSCYTYEEIESDLMQAGFNRIRLLRQGEHMDAVVEGFKA
jgi:SAM-dependent methyltransferase